MTIARAQATLATPILYVQSVSFLWIPVIFDNLLGTFGLHILIVQEHNTSITVRPHERLTSTVGRLFHFDFRLGAPCPSQVDNGA